MLINILIGLAAVIVLFAIVIAMRPAAFRIARSATIAVPPSQVFEHVNDLHKWDAWSPWVKYDPACKKTFEGPPEGRGASMTWSGNNKIGEGRMTITESRPDELIRIALNFFRPFKANHTAEFTFVPQGDGTVVTWSMSGHNGFICKAFGMFMNMDKMLGGEFERGLAQMKAVAETPEHAGAL